MPSLKALEEFKRNFSQVGSEAKRLAEQNEVIDELALPTTEAASVNAAPDAATAPAPAATETSPMDDLFDMSGLMGAGLDDSPQVDDFEAALSDVTGGTADADANDDMEITDFSGFGDLQAGDDIPSGDLPDDPFPSESDDVPGSPIDDPSLDDLFPVNASEGGDDSEGINDAVLDDSIFDMPEGFADSAAGDGNFDDINFDDLNLGDDAVGDTGIGDITDAALPDLSGAEQSDGDLPDIPDSSDISSELLDFSDFPDDASGIDNLDANGINDLDASGIDDLDASGIDNLNASGDDATGFDNFDTDGLDSFDANGGDPSVDDIFSGVDLSGFNVDDVPGEDSGIPDFPEEAAPDDGTGSTASDDDDFNFPADESSDFFPESDNDSFDTFNIDNNEQLHDMNVDGDDANSQAAELGDLDEFNLPGLDPIGGSGKSGAVGRSSDPSSYPGFSVKKEEIEEILLTEEDYNKLQETLLSFPLNLRLVCEQLIVEEAVEPGLMSGLIKLLVRGASAKETALHAGKILGKPVIIPKGQEKKTGEDFEAYQTSFYYIFVNRFLPVIRIFIAIALVAASIGYLSYEFLIRPSKAESIYKQGYERISAGEYAWANRRFEEAFEIKPKKNWFYKYAEAFRDERQYIEAEKKYQELLNFTASKNKKGRPEKKAVLEYAAFAANYMRDYEKADILLRHHILNYSVWDKDALLALGDVNLSWGEFEPPRLEDAREAYVRYIDRYGRGDAVMERMLKYFIMTDNLAEVISLQQYFMFSERRKISASTLAELGGYYMDKRTQVVRGVPNENLERIGGIREILLRAVRTDVRYPESYYHLARYYDFVGNTNDEAITLERALLAFDVADEESSKRIKYHIESIRRYAEILLNRKQFFPAEEYLVKGVNVYEDGVARRVINRTPEFGRLYADLGDLEYFVKSGDMNSVLDYYGKSEQSGYAPPEIQYRMGAAHYHLRQWPEALGRFVEASSAYPFNRRILHALGNVSYLRGNYHAAQGYYDRLLDVLEADRVRFPSIVPTDNTEHLELAERIMVTQNNLGVVLEALTVRTGSNNFKSRAMGLFTESERSWDIITRNPITLVRLRPSPDITAPSVNPAFLNVRNSIHPVPGYEPQFFIRIDRDILEPSLWEELAPPAYRLSEGLVSGLN